MIILLAVILKPTGRKNKSALDHRMTSCALWVPLVCLMTVAAQSQRPTWDRLGDKECYGQTCKLNEFCSDNPVKGKGCRQCSEILGSSEVSSSWCHDNKLEELRQKYPSCEALCLRDRIERLNQQVQQLENKTELLYNSLDEERQTAARLHMEINATGVALRKALDDPCKQQLETLRERFVAQENQLNATTNILEDARAAALKSKHELDRLSAEKENLTKENDELKKDLDKYSSDKNCMLWKVLAGVCGSLFVLLLIGDLSYCAKKLWERRKLEPGANTENFPPQGDNPQDPTQLPLLTFPETPATPTNNTSNGLPCANNDHRFGNNLRMDMPDTDGRREQGRATSVQATPSPSRQTDSASSGVSSGTPQSSSSSSLSSHKLYIGGTDTEANINDSKDFTKTAEFQC